MKEVYCISWPRKARPRLSLTQLVSFDSFGLEYEEQLPIQVCKSKGKNPK